jgi:hypothetical protein
VSVTRVPFQQRRAKRLRGGRLGVDNEDGSPDQNCQSSVRWRAILLMSTCLSHKGQEPYSRTLAWVKERSVWGCSECAWAFNPADPPAGRSLDDMIRYFQARLSEQFAAHLCVEYPRAKGAHLPRSALVP